MFPWYLVVRQFWHTNRKRTALILAALNILFYLGFIYYGFTGRQPWDRLALGAMVTGMAWAACAWIVQYAVFGRAPRRYFLAEWKNWLQPLAIAMILGMGVAVFFAIFPMLTNRAAMYQSRDLLPRSIILWDFFKFIPASFCFSIPLGLWWAGERDRFSSSRILSYIFALGLFALLMAGTSSLFFFLITHGNLRQPVQTWWILPLHPEGLQKLLLGPLGKDYTPYFIVPLLLGLTPRIRDFFRKSLIYFPLLLIYFTGYYGYSHHYWQFMQGQILYKMSTDVPAEKDRAYAQAELLLARFPDLRGWPAIGLKLARYYYQSGDTQKARSFYEQVSAKVGNSPRWTREAALAAAVLKAPGFGDPTGSSQLDVPAIGYESYMTGNWMTLIRLMRFYEQDSTSESESLLKLKQLSGSDTEIKLSPMPTLAELDDHAASLGYKTVLLPAELGAVTSLLKAGYPVIQPIRHTFYLLYGLDEGRALVTAACYENLQPIAAKMQTEALADTRLGNNPEQRGSDKRQRLNELAATELPYSFWHGSRQLDMGPVMAVVVPQEQFDDFLAKMNYPRRETGNSSAALLTGLISLNALKSGDIAGAVNWSARSYALEPSPFPLHVAHLATVFWNSRNTAIGNSFKLEHQFPELMSPETFLQRPENKTFLSMAREQFDADRDHGRLSWMIRAQYADFLDRSQDDERKILTALIRTTVDNEPFSREDWIKLTELTEWDDDMDATLRAYEGTLNCGYWNDHLAIRLAYLYIQAQKFSLANNILEAVSPKVSRYNPDYYYCLGAIAKSQGKDDEAAANYEKAIGMRKSNASYHADLAALLKEQHETPARVARLQSWATLLNPAPKASTGSQFNHSYPQQ